MGAMAAWLFNTVLGFAVFMVLQIGWLQVEGYHAL
jgi:hypothetical protein